MDSWEKFILLIVVLQAVWSLLEKVRGGRPAEVAEGAPAEVFDGAAAQVWAERAVEQVGVGRQRLDVLIERTDALIDQVQYESGPLARVLHALNDTRSGLEGAAEELKNVHIEIVDAAPDLVLEVAENHDGFGDLFGQIHLADMRLGLLRTIIGDRTGHDHGALIADADTLADALLYPMRAFADSQGIEFPQQAPICIPTSSGSEAVLMGLFPDHPIVFVPADFRGDIMRWVAVAHEMGHVLWRYVQGFEREASRIIGASAEPLIPHRVGNRAVFDIHAVYDHWMPEILADVMAVQLLGPAALRGLAHVFADPEDPESVIEIATAADGRTVASHPPAHLRVQLAGRLLHREGYIVQAEALLRQWDRQHGAPTEFILPTAYGDVIRVPQTRMLELGHALVEDLYTRKWSSLHGHTLSAVSGLEMTIGVWARVERRAADLLSDTPFNDEPRVVIAAAVEAAGQSPAAEARIARGVQRAIVSDSIDERHVADAHYTKRKSSDDWALDMRDVVDAVVLRSAWYRPHRRGLKR